ncbi:hypothetical protein M8J77_010891 [Diaphorina citri]|nr:hypothetical protein M8J77_010891 [Diaphorina citri]
MWCPSHCDIKGNAIFDNAAKIPIVTAPLKLCAPEDLKPDIASTIKTDWQNQWNNVANTNKLKAIRPHIKQWNTSNQRSTIKEVILTRMRLGHTRLTHNHLFTKSDPPICQCGAPLTVRHLLSCPRHPPRPHSFLPPTTSLTR